MVREHGPLVFATAWRILGHAADTEDVVQEVFLEIHRNNQPIRHWPAFLRRMAACRALDRLRQRKTVLPLDGVDPLAAGDSPEEAVIGQELAERLRQAVAQLPQREGAVFCLRYFEDLSYQQIAETLNVSPAAVAAALHKARAKLEGLLTEAAKGE
jgi:RNA polymerase sigma-70 factor (ECF subfamily)